MLNDETPTLTTLTGTITKFLFQNAGGWGVALFKSDEQTNASVKIKGQIGQLRAHVNYQLSGNFEQNSKYGKSFQVVGAQLSVGKTKTQAINYLSSALFPGIGVQAATLIADHYQENIIEKIMAEPASLKAVPGLNEQKATLIESVLAGIAEENFFTKVFYEQNLKIDFYNFLKEHAETDDEVKNILETNFYEYARMHHLTPFEEVEKVAVYFEQLTPENPRRIAWAARKVTEDLLNQSGNTYTSLKALTPRLQTYTHQFDPDTLRDGLLMAKQLKLLHLVEQKIYTDDSWNDENLITAMVQARVEEPAKESFNDDQLESLIQQIEQELAHELKIPGFCYDVSQKEALKKSVTRGLFLLTGGPGTGKTTVIKGVYKLLTYLNPATTIKVAAPTGRAAARLNEIDAELNATTIHKLLGAEENGGFRYNASNEFDFNCLILDEASMIENFLFARVVEATRQVDKLILVGDQNQLPSVGYGELFANLLSVKQISQVHLEQPHRQENGNGIINLAYQVLNKEVNNVDDLTKLTNVHLVLDQPVDKQLKTIEEIFISEVSSTDRQTLLDVQVIAPFYKGELGIDALNNLLQTAYQTKVLAKGTQQLIDQTWVRRNGRFSQDDKIMYLVNDGEMGLNNGDVGLISQITQVNHRLESATVCFNDLTKQFHTDNFNSTALSYACSVHKTQGSEYKNVLLVLEKGMNEVFINNKIIYTAITRAKKNLTIIGDFETFHRGINKKNLRRLTTLTSKIEAALTLPNINGGN